MRKAAMCLLLVLVSTTAFAQPYDRDERWRERRAEPHYRSFNPFELTPFGGFRYGGTLWADRSSLFGFDTSVASNPNVGLNFGIPIGDTPMKLELMVNQQKTHLSPGDELFGPDVNLADMDVTYYHAGLQIPFGDPRSVNPFLVLSAGVANLRPDIAGVSSENRFSGSAGLGVKVPVTRHIGFRIEARGYFTSLSNDDDRDDCFRCDGDWGRDLYQGETNFGLVISF